VLILDTNVISELMRANADAFVSAWIDDQPLADIYTTSITQAELFYGLELMPSGRRRDQSVLVAEQIIRIDLANRVLSFDSLAADQYAIIASRRRQMGRPISMPDAQIAAIVIANAAVLVTRNVVDFEHCGVKVINPWLD